MTSFYNQYFSKSIRISQDGFYFAKIINGKCEKAVFNQDLNALLSVEATKFFNEEDNLDVILSENVPMLIPNEIFNSSKTNEYLRLHTDLSKSAKTITENFGEYVALSPISNDRSNSIESLPNKVTLHTEASVIYRYLKDNEAFNTILVIQNKTFFDLAVVAKGQLQLLNRFESDDTNDTIYYILNAIKTFGIKSPEIIFLDVEGNSQIVSNFFISNKLRTTRFEL